MAPAPARCSSTRAEPLSSKSTSLTTRNSRAPAAAADTRAATSAAVTSAAEPGPLPPAARSAGLLARQHAREGLERHAAGDRPPDDLDDGGTPASHPLRQAASQRRLADSRLAQQQHARASGKDCVRPGQLARAADEGPAPGHAPHHTVRPYKHAVRIQVGRTDYGCAPGAVSRSILWFPIRGETSDAAHPSGSGRHFFRTAADRLQLTGHDQLVVSGAGSAATPSSASAVPAPELLAPQPVRGGELARSLPAGHESSRPPPWPGPTFGAGKEETNGQHGKECVYGSQTTNVFTVEVGQDPNATAAQADWSKERARAQRLLTKKLPAGISLAVNTKDVPGLGAAAAGRHRFGQRGRADHRLQRDLPAQGRHLRRLPEPSPGPRRTQRVSHGGRSAEGSRPGAVTARLAAGGSARAARGPVPQVRRGPASGAGGVALSRPASCRALVWA